MHFTQKTKSIQRSDLDDFVKCYKPGALRKTTWAEKTPEGRWRGQPGQRST